MIDRKFIADRISNLRMQRDISERELSLALGKGANFINSITSGRVLPRMESFFDICDYFNITPFEFFFTGMDDPMKMKEIYDEILRLSNNNISDFLLILKSLNTSDYSAFLSFMNRYKWNKDHELT